MGIFDFIKTNKSEEKNVKKDTENKKTIGITLEETEILVYDSFGREKKVNKTKWINEVLNVNVSKHWNDPDLLSTSILEAFSKKVYPETREACLRLYTIDDNNERKTNILGMFYTKVGRYNDAIELYERYLFRNVESETVLLNYANALEIIGKSEEANQKYLEVLNLNINSEKAIKKYFKKLELKSREEFDKNLLNIAQIEGAWCAKLLLAITYFKRGNKFDGDKYLIKALEESEYNSQTMGIASGIYGMNELYDEFEKYVVPNFHPEKHGVYTVLNMLEYYKIKNNYEKGLEICKISSKFNWDKFFDKFLEYEVLFESMRNKFYENRVNENRFILLETPLWYEEFNEGKWLLNNEKDEKKSLLILPFAVINENLENDSLSEKLSHSLPLYINEIIHYNSGINNKFFIQIMNEKYIVPNKKYSREYMSLIKKQNNLLNYILSGNIYSILEDEQIKYRVEIYLFDYETESKITLINELYNMNELYKIMQDVIEKINNVFSLRIENIYDKNNDNLFLYEEKLIKKLEDENKKIYKAWEYKKIVKKQIDIVLDDEKNVIKKINLIALLYEISLYNGQLLKNIKPLIYNMIENNFFNEEKLRLLIPIIYNIYHDEENYNNFIEEINGKIDNHEYIDWLNKFLTYVE